MKIIVFDWVMSDLQRDGLNKSLTGLDKSLTVKVSSFEKNLPYGADFYCTFTSPRLTRNNFYLKFGSEGRYGRFGETFLILALYAQKDSMPVYLSEQRARNLPIGHTVVVVVVMLG